MQWLSRLRAWAARERVERVSDTFVPHEWNDHLGGLTLDERRAFAVNVCRKVLATGGVQGEVVEPAIRALAHGQVTPDLLGSVRSLVERFEGEYDSLVGHDESKLLCTDPVINTAFVRAIAATALQCALEGNLSGMAYEAWFVLDDLDEIRRLAGMPQPKR
jgi:hypothetical protein